MCSPHKPIVRLIRLTATNKPPTVRFFLFFSCSLVVVVVISSHSRVSLSERFYKQSQANNCSSFASTCCRRRKKSSLPLDQQQQQLRPQDWAAAAAAASSANITLSATLRTHTKVKSVRRVLCLSANFSSSFSSSLFVFHFARQTRTRTSCVLSWPQLASHQFNLEI